MPVSSAPGSIGQSRGWRMSDTPWIVVDLKRNGSFACNRCGDVRVVVLPMNVDEYVKASRAFERKHRKWQEVTP